MTATENGKHETENRGFETGEPKISCRWPLSRFLFSILFETQRITSAQLCIRARDHVITEGQYV
jgi:hypothetical protein